MTVYRLMDGVSGRPGVASSGTQPPATATSFGSLFNVATAFAVTQAGYSLQGYWIWYTGDVNQGKDPQNCGLIQITGALAGSFVSGSLATSGTLSSGWNYVPLSSTLALTANTSYLALWALETIYGPFTQNQFGSGQPYAAGITNGPLMAYSDHSGSNPEPHNNNQGEFGAGDFTTTYPNQAFNSSNFWIDVQVGPTPTSGSGLLMVGLP